MPNGSKSEKVSQVIQAPVDRYKSGAEMQPMGETALRERMLKAAGLTDEDLGRMLRDALDEAHRQLHAGKVVVVSYKGAVTAEKVYEDGPTRLKAAELIVDTAGAKPSRTQHAGPSTPVVFVFPNWFQLPTAQPRESSDVVDAEATPVTPDPAP